MDTATVERGMHIGGVTFGTFLVDLLFIFLFIMWIWLAITVMLDLFRRHDVSGVAKAMWVILIVVFPYIGIFIYLLTQSGGMARRNAQQAEAARDQLRSIVGFSVADEIAKLDKLKAEGGISEAEFKTLRGRLVAG
ncbi:PLDc N-terminal domain-containing protein [Amaricoccus sp.]|uniref:PLDc N-terminal domain-containing protein n=1 Tax=Amaricoccus sp. TaxID=1872485 RepID=UPI001B66FCAE|nr:PLDc N-terminal domain-containing protein [Amaricoccus sp.]MBP7241327.1 PLDc N-terminal domain-containing protein [Amaricoccus sp.]